MDFRKRKLITDPKQCQMLKVYGGPCDGTEVLEPPDDDKGNPHGIGIPAPPEHQKPGQPKVWCVYLWCIHSQRYGWVDFYQTNSQAELLKAIRVMAGQEPA